MAHALQSFYLMRGHYKSAELASSMVADLLLWVEVADCGKTDALRAVALGYRDFEDALQMAAAEACGADCLVTRNGSDFKEGTVPVMTPEVFLIHSAEPHQWIRTKK